jgi:uncharacterized membrane protein
MQGKKSILYFSKYIMSVNLFHVVGVAPLLGYTAYAAVEDPLPMWHVWILVILAILVVVFHSYRYYEKTMAVKNEADKPLL